MSLMSMVLIVARKEIKSILSNRGLLFAGLWFGVMFNVFIVSIGGQPLSLNNAAYSVALLVGVLVGYSFSSFVFLREKREGTIETLLCTPLSLKSIWLGKVLGATFPAYLFSLLSVALVTLVSNVGKDSLMFPSVAIIIHVLCVAPVFVASAIALMGFCQFFLGMRENRILGFLIILVLMPFMYAPLVSGLVGSVSIDVSWIEVGICLIASVLLLGLTICLTRYLSKEKIVTTIPSD